MLRIELIADRSVLVIHPEESLTSADFVEVGGIADSFIEQHGGLNGLMIETNRFPGWDSFSGLLAHLRFVRDHHQKIRRVAVVTDDPTLSALPSLAKHFVAADVRHFGASQDDEAMTWLSAV